MQPKQKCVFLDRDGVLNRERGDYTYRLNEFEVIPGVPEALAMLKQEGFLLIVITNQGGIAKGLYSKLEVIACHQKLQESCGSLINAIYMAPAHPAYSESLARKPDSLMFERAIARYNIDAAASWMVGDALRDMQAAAKAGVKGVLVGEHQPSGAYRWQAKDLLEAAEQILSDIKKPA
ncbi:HAD-IIIA family hydrolase [Pontibacter sp. SGAir0037]|uniref:D-glycero-alpha-D-manno-heptose-1,7-bisphosphate 7-phosphatase n=1 Tax=Pontibacter sp. SGAir0037 TaxID=2571030 RepID=UPI0010CD5BFD|nr:HAD family hydrolase [Pontibacter sp. SGAir0037]QCR23052.1 D,D-heptose 1,7-bisphosphate phosphatase [Pontibacter sp. SGAir0037]